MANESARGLRGWIYAVVVALCLLLILVGSEQFSRTKKPGFYHAPRTSTLNVSTKPKFIAKIATESIPLAIEPLQGVSDTTAWIEYRSSSTSSLAMLEPPSGAKLSAPIATANAIDPFLEAIQQKRSPTALAADAAVSQQTMATTVSAVRQSDSSTNSAITQNIASNPIDTNFLTENHEVSAVRNPRGWPASSLLLGEMDDLRQASSGSPAIQAWLDDLATTYNRLLSLSLNSDGSLEQLELLRELSEKGDGLAAESFNTNALLARDITRLKYSIDRRYAVWISVCRCVNRGRSQLVSARQHQIDIAKLKQCIADVEQSIQRTGDAISWNRYLMLDLLKQLSTEAITGSQAQVNLVRQFLGRVTDSRVSEAQRLVLTSAEVHKLADQLHPISIGPVDYRKIIEDIETLEADPVHRCSKTLADAMQSLRFSEHPEQAAVSSAIGTHYRNANLRIAISEDFINRMMPAASVMERPVRQTILGAETRGNSQIATNLRADVQADGTAWNIALNLQGSISSDTKSSRQGFSFYNASSASVNAVRDLRISTSGLAINGRQATVDSHDMLKRFSTEWDSLPILGDMVRHFAHEEFVKTKPLAKRIMQRTIADQTDQEFDKQLQTKVADAKTQYEKRLIGPLQSLDLHPMVIDMQSTDTRLIVRYRVASNEQLSAYTPRPVAPSDSQLSLQIHQSAFNNMALQVVANDYPWTMQDLSDKISDLIQQPRKPIDADAPHDITIRFSESRPITVEFEDGRMWLTLRVAALEQPGRIHLKNFVIRTSYLPTVDGLKANLERDGVISVDGHRLAIRDKVPLRAIFSRVFSNRSTISMVSEELVIDPRAKGLSVSQLELRDGWLAIAVSEQNSPHVALLQGQAAETNR